MVLRRRLLRLLDRCVYHPLLAAIPRLQLGKKVLVRGWPLIDISSGSRVEIGNGVLLNSRNLRYHANMFGPVKLYAENGGTIEIGHNTRVHGTCIHALECISIGANCLIAANTHILDSNGHQLSYPDVDNRINTTGDTSPVMIGDSVWIGMNCIILPGVVIGEGSVIAAGSIVTKSLPSMVLAGGVPAKAISLLKDLPNAR